MRPCVPCQHACDRFICNSSCSATATQVVDVNITGLSLNPMQVGAMTNESDMQPYYITVKAITGSGRSVIASSGGVYIDVTPPLFELIVHVDLSWSLQEPSTFQGDNSSIAVYFEVDDKESQVTWNCMKDIDMLERVQRRATKMIQKLRNITNEMRLKECGLTTLEARRLRVDQIEVFKILNGYENIERNIFFTVKKERRTRGHGVALAKKQCRLDIRQFSFSQRIVNEWNRVSADCVGASRVNIIIVIIIIVTSFAPISSKIKLSGATKPGD